jgi:arylsulfatase A-like enzyme
LIQKQYTKTCLAVLALASLVALCHTGHSSQKPKKKPKLTADSNPNVIIIFVDDLGYADMSCAGLAKDVQTPNIDRLAKAGMRFTNAYATAPICNASRIATMTDCYQQRQGNY